MERAVDLTELVERLRSAGYRVDTRQYLTAHEMLLALAERGRWLDDDPERLASHLGPIFCTSPEEQGRFAAEVRAWRGSKIAFARPRVERKPPFMAWRRWRWPLLAAGLFVTLFIVGLSLLRWQYAPVTIEGVVLATSTNGRANPAPGATVRLGGEPVVVDASGRFSVQLRRADGAQLLEVQLQGYLPSSTTLRAANSERLSVTLEPVPLRHTAQLDEIRLGAPEILLAWSPSEPVSRKGVAWELVALGSFAATALAFLFLWASDYGRRHLALARLAAHGDPELLTLSPAGASALSMSEQETRRLTAALRRPQGQAVSWFDTELSVDATVRAAGFFTPVYALRRAVPEYLALIERRSVEDHCAQLADELIGRLRAMGLTAEVYYFRDDPRICYDHDAPTRGHRLPELIAHHHRATVLLFTDASRCFDPISGTLERWVESLHAFPRRALFTPEAPARWTEREWKLAEAGVIVLPAGAAGLQAFAEIQGDWRIDALFPAPYARAFPSLLEQQELRWIDRNAPPPEVHEKLLRQLRGFLGPDGFEWLCACAVYPEISWPLTFRLVTAVGAGRSDAGGQEVLVERVLPELARLPWFRFGMMPDWLRRLLIGQLDADQDSAIRRELERLLEELAVRGLTEHPGPPSAPGLRIARWIGPLDLLRVAPPESPLSDTVFLGFMAGASIEPLAVRAPELLRKLFRRGVGELPSAQEAVEREASAGEQAVRREEETRGPGPARVFLCYRHSDSAYAIRIHEALGKRIAPYDVFVDLHSIRTGEDFPTVLDKAIRDAEVVLVAIGPQWLSAGNQDRRWIDDPSDFARREIAVALAAKKRVIPVLVGGARMPPEDQLPQEIRPLARRQAIELRDERWDYDLEQLAQVARILEGADAAQAARSAQEQSQATAAGPELTQARPPGGNVPRVRRSLLQRLRRRARAWILLRPWLVRLIAAATTGGVAMAVLPFMLPAPSQSVGSVERAVTSLAVSAGRRFAAGSANGSVTLEDVGTRVQRRVLVGHRRAVTAVAFGPDGRSLATADGSTIRFWDVASGSALGTPISMGQFEPIAAGAALLELGVFSMAYRPDGQQLATGHNGGTVFLWEGVSRERPQFSLEMPQAPRARVTALAFRDSQSLVAAFEQAGEIYVARFDLASRRSEGAPLRFRSAPRSTIALSPDASTLVAANGGRIDLWDVSTGRALGQVESPLPQLLALAIRPDAGLLAAGTGGGRLILWRLERTAKPPDTTPPPEASRETQSVQILNFTAAPTRIEPGQRAELCFDVRGTRAAFIEPEVGQVKTGRRECVRVRPAATTTYTLRVLGAAPPATSQVTIIVQPATKTLNGWCCIPAALSTLGPLIRVQASQSAPSGTVMESSEAECRNRRGLFARTKEEAEALCRELTSRPRSQIQTPPGTAVQRAP